MTALPRPAPARRGLALAAALLLAALLPASPSSARAPKAPPLWVAIVRHAEKGQGPDPALLPAGEARALALAAALRDAPLQGVYTTDTQRTRATAAPTAAAHGLDLRLYDAAAAPALIAELRAKGGAHLIVGHSDTVPGLVSALGAGPAAPMPHDEYDRLTLVFADGRGTASALTLRYGAPSRPAAPGAN